MSKYIPGNHKHLTAEDRLYIGKSLDNGTSHKDIARYLCKDPSINAEYYVYFGGKKDNYDEVMDFFIIED